MMQGGQTGRNELFKTCFRCEKSFLIATHFQSHKKPEATKWCLKCRNGNIKSQNNPTGKRQKRKNIYLSHKMKTIENSRGCQWSEDCRFKFSDRLEVDNIVIYEFDHLKEKSFLVSEWLYTAKCEQELLDEISKCRILCRFHHRIHYQNQIKEKKKTKIYSETRNAIKQGEFAKVKIEYREM